MNKKIIIYSGIQPGRKGAGNFVSFFINKFHKHNIKFNLVFYKTPNGGFLVKIAKKLGIIKILRSLYFLIVRKSFFQKKNIGSTVIIFHPQSIGLKITANLILNNKVYFYVLDSFFFCKKSYNYIEGNNGCLKCITNPQASIENNCDFLLSIESDKDYEDLQQVISSNLDSICFLTQNNNHSLLLKKKFGEKIDVIELGMLIDLNEESLPNHKNRDLEYDFVFHNTNFEAKGILYFIEVAKRMPRYRFLIPYSKSDIHNKKHEINYIDNLDFISMTWKTGLKEAVRKCKIVINPSLWSSPVEGALLKSIKNNGCVAIVPVDYSFQKEILSDTVIHLESNISESVKILNHVIQSHALITTYKLNSSKWLDNYTKSTDHNFDNFIQNHFCQ
jgi:glycosyltransferase involved in cell wall biosynthesis